ncbi:nucleotide exchange factor GrpE [Romeria aff. gracilis LEGE 07310]|uniref:Protein GrpE n=1 Tax=Vasconcelosia minhoensis LEGE 07310 TaxID=915328 RepID=A0A8J7AIT5_9CYAN|nr:nucleotide exchange factor GrpE [Romeria gracilis]MBE9076185.1 nucleotide exchange factor GrpE [Romeria aff. gracilis LEGE 07310]
MMEGANPTDNPQSSSDETPVELEELRDEDASIEIDFEQEFQSDEISESADAEDADAATADAAMPGPAGPPAEDNSAAIASFQQQIANLQAQVEDRTGQYMRLSADFENFRKRSSKEKEDLEAQVKCNTIGALLEVIDNFERARSQIKPQTEAEMTIHKSYQSVYKQLVEGLKRLGVAPMRAEGQEFDPNLHEAVMREPTDKYEEGIVIDEFVRGYLLGERVLRHAMVKVAAPPEPSAASDAAAPGEDAY